MNIRILDVKENAEKRQKYWIKILIFLSWRNLKVAKGALYSQWRGLKTRS